MVVSSQSLGHGAMSDAAGRRLVADQRVANVRPSSTAATSHAPRSCRSAGGVASLPSASDEPRNRVRDFGDLRILHLSARARSLGEAMADVVVQQDERHSFQCPRRCSDLSENIDAVLLLLDHPGNAANLAFDAT